MHVHDCLRENTTYIKEVQQTAHHGVQLHIISAGVVACMCICACTCTCDNARKRSWESFEIIEQVHESMVLIVNANSEGSGDDE